MARDMDPITQWHYCKFSDFVEPATSVLIVVSSKFVSVYVVFGLWVREKKGLKFGNREEGKYVLLVREKIQEETVPKVGGNQSAGYVKWVL